MNDYQIGRDLEALRCRLDRLECADRGHYEHDGHHGHYGQHDDHRAAPMAHDGHSAPHASHAGVSPHVDPFLWKPDHAMQLPPFLRHYIREPNRGAHVGAQFNVLPESKTWTCHPEPLVLSVNWFSGGTDPFYQYQDQLFSILRFTDPNTGHISASATYQARRVALGKAKTHYFAPSGNPHYQQDPGYYTWSQFRITLRGPAGSNLGLFVSPSYNILDCHEAFDIEYAWEINPGIYELVTGATWEVTGAQTVDRC